MKPIIGIMPREEFDEKFEISYIYTYESVRRMILDMGGVPLIITPCENTDMYKTSFIDFPNLEDEYKSVMKMYLDKIDGLFLPGGSKYTKFDLEFIDAAIKRYIPILGVCLGAQSLSNYKKEFSLEKIESKINHNTKEKYAHSIKIDKESTLYKIIGKENIMVNSYHNRQMSPNPLFRSVAYAEDGVLEAIEMKGNDFVMGLQWHPEKMYKYDLNSKKILDYFIKKCEIYSKEKKRVVKI